MSKMLCETAFLALVFISAAESRSSEVLKAPAVAGDHKCQPIRMPHCLDQKWSTTSFPNPERHETQEEAAVAMRDFLPLVGLNCSAELKTFLCGVYVPFCGPSHRVIRPCRSLCQRVRRGCQALVQQAGFAPPAIFECERYEDEEHGMCMNPATEHKSAEPCRAVPIEESSHLYNAGVAFGGVQNCGPPCKTFRDAGDEHRLATSLTVLTCLCLFLSLVSLLMHAKLDELRQYPQWTIAYISGCYVVCSMAFLLRLIWGHESTSCTPISPSSHISIRQTDPAFGINLGRCLVSFAMMHFSVAAAASWFAVAGITWYLSVTKCFASEVIDRLSKWFHLSVWLSALLETSLALSTSSVSGDPSSGFCFLNSRPLLVFFVIPMLLKALVPMVPMGLGMRSASHILKSLPAAQTENHRRLVSHMMLFCACFVLPAAAAALLGLVKAAEGTEAQICRGVGCRQLAPSVWLAVAEYSSLLLPGICCGILSVVPVIRASPMLNSILERRRFAKLDSNLKELPPIPMKTFSTSSDNVHLANHNLANHNLINVNTLDSGRTVQTFLPPERAVAGYY